MLKVFSVDFVMEAIALERPMHEIIEQLDDCLSFIRNNDIEFRVLTNFGCALETINQYQQSLQWTDSYHLEKRELPEILSCEYGDICDYNSNKIDLVLSQIIWLIDEGKTERATIALENWLGDYSPYTLSEKLNNIEEKDISDWIEEHNELLKKWGCIKYKLGLPIYSGDSEEEPHNLAIAFFNSGWIRKAMKESPQRAFELMQGGLFFIIDYEEILYQLMTENCQDLIEQYIGNYGLDSLSIGCQLRFAFWCVLNNRGEWCTDLLESVLDSGFDLIPKSNVGNKENSFEYFAITFFIMSLYDREKKITSKNFKDYVNTAVSKTLGYEKEEKSPEFWRANNLMLGYHILADTIKFDFEDISESTIEMIFNIIFEESVLWATSTINGVSAVKTLLETFLTLSIKFNNILKDYVLDCLIKVNVKL